MSKLNLAESDLGKIVYSMSEGNPGATMALAQIINNSQTIDPDNNLGPFGPIFLLDTYGIYGADIYVLWKDKCGTDLSLMLSLLRAVQFGIYPVSKLRALAKDHMRTVEIEPADIEEITAFITEELPTFKTDPFFV